MTDSPWIAALRHPLHLAMLAVTLGAGLCSAWWLLPVGLVLWGMMLFWFARDPLRRLSHRLQQRGSLAPRFQPYFDQLERSQVALFNTLAGCRPPMRRALAPVQAATEAVVEEAYQLCYRLTSLENHRLMSRPPAEALRQVGSQLEQARDARVQRDLEDSRRALEKQSASLDSVTTYLARVEAQLSTLTHELDRTLTEVMRLQTLGPAQAKQEAPALTLALRRLHEELRRFDKEAAER